jgi:hypothetical protein
MLNQYPATPAFGGKLQSPEFYSGVNSIIGTLRKVATLRTIAEALNQAGFATPAGLSWNKGRLANYLGSTAATTITNTTHSN